VTSELVERAQRGDHEAFDALATAAYHRMYAIARRILRDGYAAEDAVQDALVKAWREVRGLRDTGAFDAWLHRLLVNACRDHARRSRRRPIELPALSIERAEPRDDLAQLADRDELERAFLELSVEHRTVLVLTHQHPRCRSITTPSRSLLATEREQLARQNGSRGRGRPVT